MNIEKRNELLNKSNIKLSERVKNLSNELEQIKGLNEDNQKQFDKLTKEILDIRNEWLDSISDIKKMSNEYEKEIKSLIKHNKDIKRAKYRLFGTVKVSKSHLPKRFKMWILRLINKDYINENL